MGNSNSSSSSHFEIHGGMSSKWTESLEPPDQRNRMKRSYFQPRNNAEHPAKALSRKVLPVVNPTEVALRPTSNGAILHGGGTISGRKLLSELELNNSTIATNPSSDSKTMNNSANGHIAIHSPRSNDVNFGVHTRTDSVNIPNNSTVPYPNQFSIINESPSKKQIRSKKKYQAPLPPVVSENRISKNTELTHKGSKRLNRMFKTKVETKSKLLTSEVESELKTRLKPREHSLDNIQEINSNKRRPRLFPSTPPPSQSQLEETEERVIRIQSTSNRAQNENQNRGCENPSGARTTALSTVAKETTISTSSTRFHPTVQSHEAISGQRRVPVLGLNTGDSGGNGNRPLSSPIISSPTHKNEEIALKDLGYTTNANVNTNRCEKKNTFYFGMNASATSSSTNNDNTNSSRDVGNELGRGQKYSKVPDFMTNEKANFEGRTKMNERKGNRNSRMTTESESPNKMGQSSHHSRPTHPKKIKAQLSAEHGHVKSNRSSHKSESDSEDFRVHQSSVSRNDSRVYGADNNNKTKGMITSLLRDDFSSDLSSSEMDIPPLIRPTLPQKRNELPSFSPVAAWQALESPHPSGRSNSSEEGFRFENRIQKCTHPIAPLRNGGNGGHERSGDSGISAGDGGSPANHMPPDAIRDIEGGNVNIRDRISNDKIESFPHYPQRNNVLNGSVTKCWTPQQDLDDSSSDNECDGEVDIPPHYVPHPISVSSRSALMPQTPPKLTTRSNLFHQCKTMLRNDSPVGRNRSGAEFYPDEGRQIVLNPRSSEMKDLGGRDSGNNYLGSSTTESNSRQRRRIKNIRCNNQLNHEIKSQDFLGLDTNWFLSRSEPNSLNETDLMMLSEPLDFAPCYTDFQPPIDETFFSEESQRGKIAENSGEARSEIGYGPSNMNSYNNGMHQQNEYSCNNESESNSLILFRRPLHIMYLPAYDSRRLHSSYANQRRSKSVDSLEPTNVFFQKQSNHNFISSRLCSNEKITHKNKSNSNLKNEKISTSVGAVNNFETQKQQRFDSEVKSRNKAKFKFQSTLRVLERKRIEKELTQVAKERETKRLREAEEMKICEEEFQKKRLKDKLEIDAANQLRWAKSNVANSQVVNVSLAPWEAIRRSEDFKPKGCGGSGNSSATSITSNSSRDCASSANKLEYKHMNFKGALPQRQEPDGAPASSIGSDLRKEVIHASKKRNGITAGSTSSDLTQELSEYRQETRQYWDYRRNPRKSSSSPNRFGDSSRSSVRTCSRTTVHPEVVCDIPGRQFPYVFNDSRLSGSLSNILSTEAQSSGFGNGTRSGPSSIISDNYRRDWAHKSSGGSVLGGNGMQRASSIISLHSAPGFQSECLRGGVSSDLTVQQPFIPRGYHEKRSRKQQSKATTSSRSSPLPAVLNSSMESSVDHERNHNTNVKGLLLPQPPPPSGMFQPQPFNNNKTKEYRPVVFKPKTTQSKNKSTIAIIHSVNY